MDRLFYILSQLLQSTEQGYSACLYNRPFRIALMSPSPSEQCINCKIHCYWKVIILLFKNLLTEFDFISVTSLASNQLIILKK